VGSRAGLEDAEKRKFLTLSGLELWPLGRPASPYTEYAISAPAVYILIVVVVVVVVIVIIICRICEVASSKIL
jgi:hypothetical protein